MKRKYVYVLLHMIAMIMLVSCSATKSDISSESNKSTESSPITYGTSGNSAGNYDTAATESQIFEDDAGEFTTEYTKSEEGGSAQNVSTNRKLIKKVYLDLQTLEFMNTVNFILEEVKVKGGYVETSNIQGNAIYENDRRSAKLVVRISSDMTDAFVNLVGENASVISKSEETRDITKEYVDTQSRIKMLEIEQERLLTFLEKAESLKDMITLEDRLGEVRYELEGYASTLKTYENLVDYATVTITISEVKEIVTKVEKQSALSRMGSGLNDTLTDIRDGFTNFIVWLIINLPYFVVWGGLIAVCIVIGLKANKRYKTRVRTAVNNTKGDDIETKKEDTNN